jgi:L-malate glycosyltransferase
MRVLHVSHTAVVSGAEHSLLTLIAALPSEVIAGVACPPGELAERAHRMGVAVYTLPQLRVSLRVAPRQIPTLGWSLLRAALIVAAAARRSGATVVHANSLRAAIIAMSARAFGAPPFVAHVRDVLPSGRLPLLLNRAVRRRARSVVALSHYVAAGFSAGNGRGAPISVIDNPVDLRRFLSAPEARGSERRELGIDSDVPLLGIVGQITSWKGHDTAIQSLALLEPPHANASLLVVGAVKFTDSSTRLDNLAFLRFCEEEVTRLGLNGRVVFAGEREDIPAVLAALDLLVVPSVEEPFGRIVAEAMVVGTPVVATTVGGPAEIVEDGVTGLLAPPGEPEQWARTITRMLDDRDGARAMAERARAVASSRFDAQLHAARMLEIFEAAAG